MSNEVKRVSRELAYSSPVIGIPKRIPTAELQRSPLPRLATMVVLAD